MGDVIKSWFAKQLGVVLTPEVWNQRPNLLLARLLASYNFISSEELDVIEGEELTEAFQITIEHIRNIINTLGVNFTKENYEDFRNSKGTVILKLFSELFLSLHDKDKATIPVDKKMKEIFGPENSRFTVTKKEEEVEMISKFDNPLAEPLIKFKEAYEWAKVKYDIFLKDLAKHRDIYLANAEQARMKKSQVVVKEVWNAPEKIQEQKLPCDVKSVDLTMDELLAEEKSIREKGCFKENPKIAKKIINNLKQKQRKDEARKALRSKFQKLLMKELWDKVLGDQEEYYKTEFNKKMLKQSLYEQQMATKLLEVRQRSSIMIDNKIKLMETIRKMEEKQSSEEQEVKFEGYTDKVRMMYYEERQRNLELHRRLYEEKMKKRAEANQEICKDVLNDFIDIALYKSTFKDYCGEEIDKRLLKDIYNLFIKAQPIFSTEDNIADIMINHIAESASEIVTGEMFRQNCMDDMAFEDYCCFRFPWKCENFEVDPSIELSLNILGYIVHRLLLEKYPMKPKSFTVDIPKPEVAVCLNGLQSFNYLPALQELLKARKIKVIQIEDAVNYCLSVFKRETTEEYLEEVFVNETDAAIKSKKTSRSNSGSSKKRKSKKSMAAQAPSFFNKESQTPERFPCEDLILSPTGELGKTAFEILNLGETLNSHLTASMFSAYLKTLTDYDGWVLINYPQTFEQAAILEEQLTSIPVPLPDDVHIDDSIMDVAMVRYKMDTDKFKAQRLSKLLTNPKPVDVPLYDTYLTAFIEMKSTEGDLDEAYYNSFMDGEGNNQLYTFYEEQGCKYNLFYKTIDFATIKQLGKLILGDYSLPPKASVELFTDSLFFVEANWKELTANTVKIQKVGERKADKKKKKKDKKSDTKTGKSKTDNKSKKDKKKKGKKEKSKKDKSSKKSKKSKSSKKSSKKSKKSRASSLNVRHENKETQIPEPPESDKESEEELEPDPLPGEPKWIYVNLPLPEVYSVALATLWENIENTYINDFKQLLFRGRLLLDARVPYSVFLKQKMRNFITRPDNKQEYLHQFQIMYNEIDDDLRDDEEFKAEMHVRINEFREGLCKICDNRLRECEEERIYAIEDNIVVAMLCEKTNIYIQYLLLEIDRCTDTMQLLMDYYTAMVTQLPNDDEILKKIDLEKTPIPTERSNVNLKVYETYLQELLKDVNNKPSASQPFQQIFDKNYEISINKLDSVQNAARNVYEKLFKLFNPSTKTKKPIKNFQQPSQEVRDRGNELLLEFQYAYAGEYLRALLRANVIRNTFKEFIEDFLCEACTIFHSIYHDIGSRYQREIDSIEKACELFSSATEAETKIQYELIFDGDMFYVKPNSLMFESPLPEGPEPIRELEDGIVFSICQLERIANIMKILAPDGLIPERTFAFMLQEFLVNNVEDGSENLVPKMWTQMHPHKTHAFVLKLFGQTEYVDWKDFIVYNFNVPFPTEKELLEIRLKFSEYDPDKTELVYKYHFNTIPFWFESSTDNLRAKLIKCLLFELFKVGEEQVNYAALLLIFCKDVNPIIGVAKAISLALGHQICWEYFSGNAYYQRLVSDKIREERRLEQIRLEKEETDKMIFDVLVDVSDRAVHQCTSLIIEEIMPEENPIEEHLVLEEILDEVPYMLTEEEGEEETVQEENSTDGSMFTNCSQYHETSDFLQYRLDFDTLISVLTVSMPWLAKTQNIDGCSLREWVALIYESKRDPDFHCVFSHHFFNDVAFSELLEKVYKFWERNPLNILKELIDS